MDCEPYEDIEEAAHGFFDRSDGNVSVEQAVEYARYAVQSCGAVTTTRIERLTAQLAEALRERDEANGAIARITGNAIKTIRRVKAKRDELAGLLRECADTLEESNTYVSPYFVEKHSLAEPVARARKLLEPK
jgi:acyl-CoA reductase-like NAD-dependent aldehyde dehydrogenase